jgi:hypothetical protein
MSRINITEHLTPTKTDKLARATWSGMAHFAGTGPKGTTCRTCVHWAFDGYLSSKGTLKDTICEQYSKMMNGRTGGRVPHDAPSCKYYEPMPGPPAIYDPKV